MQKIYVYHIVDDTSEGIIHTFMAPNDVVAVRSFAKFINNLQWKDSIVPDDFRLIRAPQGIETYEVYSEVRGSDCIEFGGEVFEVKNDES